MFAKIDVNGDQAAPLYQWLKMQIPGDIGWNFTKYLLNRDGVPVARWDSNVEPGTPEMTNTIEALLAQQT